MKNITNYILFLENKNSEKKALKKIRKFFNVDNISQKAIKLNTKLSVWIINQFINKVSDGDSDFRKQLKNGDITSEQTKYLLEEWEDFEPDLYYIFDWLNTNSSEEDKKNFTKLTFDEAYEKSDSWHNSLIAGGVIENEHGEIILKFDDGFYWIDLETTYDPDEANAMGHCGNTDKGTTLYSLRDRNKQPHITVSIDVGEGIIFQMKGKNNKKPIDKYHKYIVELLIDKNIKGFGSEYDKENDFSPNDLNKELYDKLIAERPNINVTIYSDKEIDEKFNDFLDVYYISEPHFYLVSWTHHVCGMKSVISSIFEKNDTLFNILCNEITNKVDNDDTKSQFIKEKFNFDFASKYLNADTIAEKYAIKLSNSKDSSFNKWSEINGYLGYEEIENIIIDNGLEDKYISEFDKLYTSCDYYKDMYSFSRKSIFGDVIVYDYESILNFFFDDDEKKIMETLEEWFQLDYGKYEDVLDDVFDLWDLADDLSNNLTRVEKESIIEDYDFMY